MLMIQILPYITHLWFALLVIAVLVGIAVHTWQYRQEPGARWQSYLQACKGVWLLTLVLSSQPAVLERRILWGEFGSLLSIMSSYLWFQFIAQLSGSDRRVYRWLSRAMVATVATFALIILTNPWHHSFWVSWQAAGIVVRVIRGPASIVAVYVAYLMNTLSMVMNVRWALRCAGLRRRQAWLFLLPSLIVWMGQFLSHRSGFNALDPLPMTFFLSSLITTWAFYRWRIYSIVPLAREVVVKFMIDGLMVVDDVGYIVELNATARSLFDGSTVCLGKRFEDAVQTWPALASFSDAKSGTAVEAKRMIEGIERAFRMTQTPLQTPAGHRLGWVLVLKDITQEKQQQARIVEQQKALSMLEERERLGRELHDGRGQVWSFFAMQLHALQTLMEGEQNDRAHHVLQQLQQVVQDMHLGLRESITGLQTGVTNERGFLDALEEQFRWYREHCQLQTELQVRCAWQDEMLSLRVEAQLFRILQEALANVRKSARASSVRIVIDRVEEELRFLVEDDGCGFDPAQLGQRSGQHGLHIMQERAEEIGAQLRIESQPGSGTRISLSLPVSAAFSV